ncbi:hypothetical protein F5Y00DRAFT_267803 [Daldinia vernicosa]|uniref:uncharacterized protein n=1 Tax=Daldinia vernicosa TaxID=114800 RepID=UPI002007FD8F|nr:uncharacterized protein F5Y00DRAFT_267803 [Daldinia vernicosa]KAI0851090.1 hypothetical protein F5Y00DRAFT_267803 [Daldinia vernicosa]
MPSKITEAEWAAAKPDIKYLYLTLNKPLKDVRSEMNRREFEATESQYRTQFKKWGPKWIKNSKVEDMEMLSVLVEQRKGDGKESNVFEWGKLLEKGEVKKRISKSTPNTLRRLELIGNPKLPAQFVVRTPMEDRTFSLTHDLPFFQFEKAICDNTSASNLVPNMMVDPRLLTDQQAAPANALVLRQKSIEDASQYYSSAGEIILTTDTAALNALGSIIPCMVHQTPVLDPPLYRQILHSAGNNFSGLSSFPVEQILQILKATTSTDLYPLILSPSRHSSRYSARSIALSLLKGAIETGDSVTAKAILSNKSLAIDVNRQSYFTWGRQYTLIERASTLRHKNLIDVLLNEGADVNKTYQCNSCCGLARSRICYFLHGALQHAIDGYNFMRSRSEMDTEIIQMLLDAGSSVQLKTVGELFRLGQDGIALQVAPKLLLTGKGLAHELRHAITHFDKDILVHLFHILHYKGIDLTHKGIFVAAIKSMDKEKAWVLAEALLDCGAFLDPAVLRCLVRRVLYAFARDKSGVRIAERIRGINTPVETAVADKLDILCTRWIAAVSKVDTELIIELIEELKNLNIPITTFKFFYHALMEVSRVGDYEAASMLLNHIIQLDLRIGNQVFHDALSEAIRGGNESLIELILELNSKPYIKIRDYHEVVAAHYMLEVPTNPESLYPTREAEFTSFFDIGDKSVDKSVVILAASLGKEAIVRTLLTSGQQCDLNSAIDANNIWLASLLLEEYSGVVNLNSFEYCIRHRNLDMARLLISYGADPHASCTVIQRSQSECRPLFELFFKANDDVCYGKKQRSMSCAFASVIRSRDESGVKYLLDQGVDPNKFLHREKCADKNYSPDGAISPFGEAIGVSRTGSLSLVELFLKAGCDPNGIVAESSFDPQCKLYIAVPRRITAFLAAIGTRNIQMVDLFMRNGAIINPTMTGSIKRTPLQRAAEIGCFEMVELLHNFGADINALPTVNGGATALQLAAIGGYNRIVCYLLSHKANVNAPAAMLNGMTALEGAAFWGRTDTVHILLKAGAASRGKDRSQLQKAMKMAREEGHFPTADLIQDWPNLEDDGELRMLDEVEEFSDFIDWDGEA